ncbi:BN159_2729 family protein [Streptomyces albogriseolus]|uniref:BN159_2729 family protein n=1 Tax=Streptomyces albogriseolus TaxID=1887 RepID=UPI0033AA129B
MNEYPPDAVPVLRLTVAVPGLRDLYLASSPPPGEFAFESGVLPHPSLLPPHGAVPPGVDGGPPPGTPAPTELERQALAWDAARERARSVALAIEREVGTHPDVRTVWADGDTVHALLRLEPPYARWPGWCAYFGITAAAECTAPHILAGEGSRDGVRVTAAVQPLPSGPDGEPGEAHARAERTPEAAHPHPTADPADSEEADGPDPGGPDPDGPQPPGPAGLMRPFLLGGTAYDLALPYRDTHGETWYFQGRRAYDGMPLMSLDGRPERCSLAHVAEYAGPLTPVTESPSEPAPDEGDR